jgi:hypothetical protein
MKNAQAKRKTAILIKVLKDDRAPRKRSFAAVYLCEPPLVGNKYVLALAIKEQNGPHIDDRIYDTYLFPATRSGKLKEKGELPGSMQGSLSHTIAFKAAGYTLKA